MATPMSKQVYPQNEKVIPKREKIHPAVKQATDSFKKLHGPRSTRKSR